MEQLQFVECVTERDIDLLLLEELHVSPTFRFWLVLQTFGPEARCEQFLGAWHSVRHVILGESDLIFVFKDGGGVRSALLIENKILALPQPDQAARYSQRGEVGRQDGSWTTFRTCIVAPQAYLARTADASLYGVRLSYEALAGWFQQFSANDGRAAYKARLVREAIEQGRRGYKPTPHAAVTQFWADYWGLARVEFPQLCMKQPGQIAAGSDWPTFTPPELVPGRKLVHKLAEGAVDLTIADAGGAIAEIEARNREVLEVNLMVVMTGKSASIRATVSSVDRFGELASQAEAVRAGLAAACRLLSLSPRIVSANSKTSR